MNNKLKQILQTRRYTAENIARQNLEKALLDKDFKNAFSEEKRLMIAKAKAKAFDQVFDDAKLVAQQKIVDEILAKNRLCREDLTPQYACKKCQDCGYVDNHLCACAKALNAELVMKQNNFSDLKTFGDCNFEIFDNPETKKFYEIMQKWANLDTPKKCVVVLCGNTGTGKTFLMECLASRLIEKNEFVLFKTSFDLVSDCLKFHTARDDDKASILDKFFDCDALFIDDLGSEPIYKNVSREYIYQILEKRTRLGKRTIISTNLDQLALKDIYGERCFSRIFNSQIGISYKFKNQDLRLK